MASQAILTALADFLPSDALAGSDAPITLNMSLDNTTRPASSSLRDDLAALSLPSLLFSLAVRNQDMLKLFMIGGLIETFRRFAARTWNWFLSSCFLTAHFDDSDDTFKWMMVWLSKQSVWAKARDVHINTGTWGQTHHKGVEIPGLSEDVPDTGFQTKRKLTYLPAYGMTHWLRYKGTWMSVSRTKGEQWDPFSTRKDETLEVSLITRNHRVLRSLLQDAKKAYAEEDQDTVNVYGADSYNQWYRTSVRKKRPLQSIVLAPEVKNLVLDDAKDFLSTEKWYTDRGIPYRRGYLLHGVPGSGKTSLIHSIAGELGLDIFVVSLAKKGLDDSSLNELICALPVRSIALMEDIDAAFHNSAMARDGISGAPSPPDLPRPGARVPPGARMEAEVRTVTLSGLLNALDGVAAQEGRILFATTNRYEVLDEALCRPGRMDVHVEFKKATQWQARELFRCFFPPDDPLNSKEKKVLEKVKELVLSTPDGRIAAHFGKEEAAALTEQFAEIVPEGQFSMASLQGHLMRFKERPYEAVESAKEWVEKEMRKRPETVKEAQG